MHWSTVLTQSWRFLRIHTMGMSLRIILWKCTTCIDSYNLTTKKTQNISTTTGKSCTSLFYKCAPCPFPHPWQPMAGSPSHKMIILRMFYNGAPKWVAFWDRLCTFTIIPCRFTSAVVCVIKRCVPAHCWVTLRARRWHHTIKERQDRCHLGSSTNSASGRRCLCEPKFSRLYNKIPGAMATSRFPEGTRQTFHDVHFVPLL